MMKKTSDLRKDFPLLETKMNDQPLTYLDSAATSQKPKQVIDEIADYYNKYNSNIHRGVYNLAVETTDKYENVRHKVANFINAYRDEEVLFTKGTTQSLNWIAQGYVRYNLHEGDEIVTTYMEHHSNIVPWQAIAQEKNLKVKYITLTEEGKLDLDDLKQKVTDKTKIVAVTHVSNVLGTINPIKEIAAIVHQSNAILVVDGAQSVPHLPVDMQDLEADFYVFSGHKMLGPTGIGVLWGKYELLEKMHPLEYGGEMIDSVTTEKSTFKEIPWNFEGGTQNIEGVLGLGAAIDYLEEIGMENVARNDEDLQKYALEKLANIKTIEIYGPKGPDQRCGVVSFNLKGIHPHDVATFLDADGIAVRAGHHCAQPLMDWLGVSATLRASFYFYNTYEEIDKLVDSLKKVEEFFQI